LRDTACAGAANHRRADTRETYAYRTCLPTWQTRFPTRYANIPSSSRVLGSPANILPRKCRQPEIRTYISGATQYRFASFRRSTWSGERSNQISADTGMSYQSCSTRQNDGSHGCGYWHGEPWKPMEIVAMVLGFMVFWPIGLAGLGWKFWQKKFGYPGALFPSGVKNGRTGPTGRTVPAAGALRQGIGRPPVLAWARPEIALSTNGAPLNLRGWKKNARSSSPPSANSRNSWKISATPGIARSSSDSWMRIETGKPRPGNRAFIWNRLVTRRVVSDPGNPPALARRRAAGSRDSRTRS
jgi:hypothetical protein